MSKMKRAYETFVSTTFGGGRQGGKSAILHDLGKRGYSQPKLPPKTPEQIAAEAAAQKAKQRAAMTAICNSEGGKAHGYEPVPIEVLRTDTGILELLDMLETCRPGGSKSEEAYIDRFIKPVCTHEDEYGNLFVVVPAPDEGYPNILWSTHTDTVHHHDGTQKVEVTNGVAWTSDGSCLGSDDTVGNWLALEMIRAQVPGTYVFHREEETGGGGSRHLAKNHPDWLGKFDCAIALDRAGYADVITYQTGGRCASDAFANSLAAILGGDFKPCDGGVFTDTANYTGLIGECTNLSVGYFKQHGPMEHTNLGFAYRLRHALIVADWSKLVFERKPGEDEWEDDLRWGGGYGGYGGGAARDYDRDDLEDYCYADYAKVARFLKANGITIDEIEMWAEEEDDREDERWPEQ